MIYWDGHRYQVTCSHVLLIDQLESLDDQTIYHMVRDMCNWLGNWSLGSILKHLVGPSHFIVAVNTKQAACKLQIYHPPSLRPKALCSKAFAMAFLFVRLLWCYDVSRYHFHLPSFHFRALFWVFSYDPGLSVFYRKPEIIASYGNTVKMSFLYARVCLMLIIIVASYFIIMLVNFMIHFV